MQKIKAGNIGGKAKYLIPIGVFVICIFAVLLSGNHFTSYQLPVEGYSSTCESCGKTAYYSDQFTYDSNWGTYYLVNGTSFPLILKVNDMFDPSATTDVFTAYRITLRNKNTGSLIKDFSGTFPTAGYMESYRMEYYYTVNGESDVEATVLLSRNGGLSWEESYYYMTNAPPVWHFRQTHVTSTDTDKDNIPDNLDACPSQPETYNGYLDNDGCPDTVPSSSTGDSNPPSTPSVPDDSTSPVDDGSGDPATPDDGTSDTSTPDTPTDVNKWASEGERYYAKITSPGDNLLETNKYRFETEDGTNKKIYFEGAGPDEAIYDYPSWLDPNSSRAFTPSTLEEGIDGTTVAYEWDIDGDGTVDYTEKSFTHNYVLGPNEESRMVKVYFRVQMVDGDGNTFYTHADNLNFLIYKSLSMYALSCAEWSGQFAPIISEIMLFVCYFTKTLTFIPTFFIIGLVNIFSSLTEVLCVNSGMYPGWGEALALAIFGGFLLLMLIPDDLISAGFASVLAFVLGTTAPAIGIASVPLLAGISSVAVAWGIGMAGTYSSLSIGPMGIMLGLWLLALYQIFFKQGILTGVSQKSSSRSTTSKRGDKDAVTTITNTTTDVTVNVQGSKAMDGLRNVLADAVIIISLAMLLECKAGIPAYSGILSLLTAIPQMLMEFAKALGGAL
jgi:hypothetical protein